MLLFFFSPFWQFRNFSSRSRIVVRAPNSRPFVRRSITNFYTIINIFVWIAYMPVRFFRLFGTTHTQRQQQQHQHQATTRSLYIWSITLQAKKKLLFKFNNISLVGCCCCCCWLTGMVCCYLGGNRHAQSWLSLLV